MIEPIRPEDVGLKIPQLTPHEKRVIDALVIAWNEFVNLPSMNHDDDLTEFRQGVHFLQEKVMARPVRRVLNYEKD